MNILLLCGTKDSGKSSAAKFIAAYFLSRAGIIKEFAQDYNGDIDVKIRTTLPDGTESFSEFATLDLRRTDYEFVRYATDHIWPHIRLYALADELKWATSSIFGIDYRLLTGTNEDKETFTNIKWKDIKKILPKFKPHNWINEYMTIRELLQFFGTNICRIIKDDCWVSACFRSIVSDNSALAIVDDGRFPNEVYSFKEKGAKVIKFTRKLHIDGHSSETELNTVPDSEFDYVIDNSNMTLVEKNQKLFNALKQFGWISGELHNDINT